MADQRHTPGPWKIERFSNNRKEWLEIWPDPQDRLGAGTLISTIKLQIGGLDRDRDEANAALIASAPEQQAKIDRLEAEKAVFLTGWKALNAEKAELVEKAKALCDDFGDNLQTFDAHRCNLVDELRAVLAKAEPTTVNPKREE